MAAAASLWHNGAMMILARPALLLCFSVLFATCAPADDVHECACPPTHECVDGSCVCKPLDRPCRPDCDPADDSCYEGVLDTIDCVCASPRDDILSRVDISPSSLCLSVGGESRLVAIGSMESGDSLDVTTDMEWTSTHPEVVRVEEEGLVTALAPGAARVIGSHGSHRGEVALSVCGPCRYCDQSETACVPGCLSDRDCPAGLICGESRECAEDGQGEVRGLWVTRWNFQGGGPSGVRTIFERAARAGINTIFFQVRGQADAFYESAHEPWANIGGAGFGQNPGWDPLAVALEEGERHGIAVHAWLNAMPAWMGSAPPQESTPRHKVLTNPEWLMVDSSGRRQQVGDPGYIAFSPGIPEVIDHLAMVVADILDKYEVAGIHLDYIRYIGSQFSHDPVSNSRYAEALSLEPGLSRADWQREQINEVVRRVHEVVSAREGVQISAASWHNNNLYVAGSSGYRDYYQDSHAWLARRTIDALIPMNYFRMESSPSFAPMAQDHVVAASSSGRHVYMGIHVLGRENDPDSTGARMLENIEYTRSLGAQGVVLFAYPYLQEHSLFDFLRQSAFAPPDPSLPAMPWRLCEMEP